MITLKSLEGRVRDERDKRLSCRDCKGFVEVYMVHNEVWNQAFPTYQTTRRHGPPVYCCLTCLELRIGRYLTEDDFNNVLCNNVIKFGIRIGKRSSS